MYRSAFTLVTALLLFLSLLQGQSGPGGVGNATDNGLWLRADALGLADGDLVSRWPDLSGNTNDANQTVAARQPVYLANSSLNGLPVVRLDGRTNTNQGDRLLVEDDDILDGSAGITYFAVLNTRTLDNSPRGILGKRVDQNIRDGTYAYTWYFHSGQTLWLDVNTQNDRFGTTQSFADNTNHLLSFDFDGSRAQATRSRIYDGSEVISVKGERSTQLTSSPANLVIGGLNDNYPQYLGADYAEVIHYNRALSPLERLLVNNYLSGKYNIPLVSNDLYTQDDPANGNYDFDIAGIGSVSTTDRLTQARGSGLLQVANPTDLDVDEYLIWGHDGFPATLVNTAEVPFPNASRIRRTWRLSEVSSAGGAVDVGAVDLRFDLSGLGLTAPEVQLLVDTDNDGIFSDEVPITSARAVAPGLFQFDAVTALSDGTRFTLASTNATLPVDLVDLYVERTADNQVAIHWETFSETDNDYFAIERATPSLEWREIGRVAGSGTTSTPQTYQYVDTAPVTGRLYYRLRQVDYDGSFSQSPVRSVADLATNAVSLFPNPADEVVELRTHGGLDREYLVFGVDGREVTSLTSMRTGGSGATINVGNLQAGTYFVVTRRLRYRFVKR